MEAIRKPEPASLAVEALAAHPAALYLAGLSPKARKAMERELRAVARLFHFESVLQMPPEFFAALEPAHIAAIRQKLAETYSPAGANTKLAGIRGILKAASRLGLISLEKLARLLEEARAVRGHREPKGRHLSAEEIRKMMQAALRDRNRNKGLRDACLLAFLFGLGLRRSEAVAIRMEDIEGEAVRIRGKGNKERILFLNDGVRGALRAYLRVRGEGEGFLFNPVWKSGKIAVGKGMTDEAVYQAVRQRAREAGIGALSPHDFRRTFIGVLFDAGADIATVQALAGHASPATTARYDRRPLERRKEALKAIPVPWPG